jgi:hypothetical protein
LTAKSREVAIDKTGMVLGKGLIIEAKPLPFSRLIVSQHNVSSRDKVPDRLSSFLCGGVSNNAPRATIPDMKSRCPPGFVPLRGFDLDDVCSLLGEQHTRIGSSNTLGQFDNPHAVQSACHCVLLVNGFLLAFLKDYLFSLPPQNRRKPGR